MTLDKSINANDIIFDQDDFKVVISRDLDGKYQSLEIDYVNGFFGKGFTISEQGKHSSGCC